jgi:hypothetical protein
MAKFVPSDHVEALEFDFTEYGGREGRITEPTTGSVNKFFKNMKNMVKEVNALQREVGIDADTDEIKEMTDEEVAAQVAAMDESEAKIGKFQVRTIENIAELCGAVREVDEDGNERVVGGSPSVDDLTLLPYRVLQAFSTWLMGEIKPKKTTPGSKR